jgi:hypothetical protein
MMKRLPTRPGSMLRHKTGAIAVLLDSGEWLHGDEFGWFLMTARDFAETSLGDHWRKTNSFKISLQFNFPWGR